MACERVCKSSVGPADTIELAKPYLREKQTMRSFSQKLMPPFSGQVHIAESDTYRALTLDGQLWEIQYVKRSHIRVGTLSASDIKSRSINSQQLVKDVADPKLMALLDYLAGVELPFSGTDCFEYWLLDAQEKQPLALLFSCSEKAQMAKFPSRVEWTALPDAVMSVNKTKEELAAGVPPVNYRLERLVAERAGVNSSAAWFNRSEHPVEKFPAFLVSEDWPDADQQDLCRRYIERQAPRLLMLQNLAPSDRGQLESCCQLYATEVARFCGLYPQVIDEELIRALRVEARLREVSNVNDPSSVRNRRDGVLYM